MQSVLLIAMVQSAAVCVCRKMRINSLKRLFLHSETFVTQIIYYGKKLKSVFSIFFSNKKVYCIIKEIKTSFVSKRH